MGVLHELDARSAAAGLVEPSRHEVVCLQRNFRERSGTAGAVVG